VKYLRTGISWADSFRPNAADWFDRQMQALDEFTTTVTLCFTPEHLGQVPHYTSPPKKLQDFADFTSWAVQRYCAPSTVEWPEAATRDPELTRIHKQQLEVG
jgi:beta-xylosidase